MKKNGKKICVCAAQVPFVRGGAEIMVDNLCHALDQRGFDVEKVALPYKWYPYDTLRDNMLAWRMIDLDETNGMKIDLVIGTKFPSYGIRHPNKVVWLIHQFRQAYDLLETDYSDLGRNEQGIALKKHVVNFDRITMGEASRLYTISDNVANRLKRYNGLDSETLYHPPNNADRLYSNGYGDYILSVGRIDPLKRLDLLLHALRYSPKGIMAYIAGKGPQTEPLRKLAKTIGVEDRVRFLGYVNDDELLALYANAFAIYYAPLDEDYGYVTLEAYFAQKPVITCRDTGGVLEFVADGINGCVVQTDAEAIGDAMGRLWQDKALCAKYGRSGRNSVCDISWDNVVSALTQML